MRFLGLLRSGEGVEEDSRKILFSYRAKKAIVSKDKPKGSSENDELWKLPSPKREQKDDKTRRA